MFSLDREAVICDFAETYHIYTFKGLPARYVATLAVGLRENSRIKLRLAGVKNTPPEIVISALLLDALRDLRFMIARYLSLEVERGESMTDLIYGKDEPTKRGYSSAKEFEEAREKIMKEGCIWQEE